VPVVTNLNCEFNGATVLHGASVSAYQSAQVAFGQTCSSQARTCDNGVLSGSFASASCSVSAPQTCSFNGRVIGHGDTVTAYASATVPAGQVCQTQVRTCSDGQLSGSATFESCVVSQPPPPNDPPVGTYCGDKIIWELPKECHGQSGHGVGFFKSRVSLDGGKTWVTFHKNNLPQELQAVWNYLIARHGKMTCDRPKVSYLPSKNSGYVTINTSFLPGCGVCRYFEGERETKSHGQCQMRRAPITKRVKELFCPIRRASLIPPRIR
jgi:hypothetical protein